jgi:hypothetical protein
MQNYVQVIPLSTGLYEQTSNCAQSNYEQANAQEQEKIAVQNLSCERAFML